jgi:hypothetical protein
MASSIRKENICSIYLLNQRRHIRRHLNKKAQKQLEALDMSSKQLN